MERGLPKPENRILTEFLNRENLLIAGRSTALSSVLGQALRVLGCRPSNMHFALTESEAWKKFDLNRHNLIFFESNLTRNQGGVVDPISERIRSKNPKSIFISISSDSSQVTISKAAEDFSDGYLLIPFTEFRLKEVLLSAISNKHYPSNYEKLIARGRSKLKLDSMETAISFFEKAKKLKGRPSQANFYHASALVKIRKKIEAENILEEGIHFSRYHFKSLKLLVDLKLSRNDYSSAYQIFKKLIIGYPNSNERLRSGVELAVRVKKYSDVEEISKIHASFEGAAPGGAHSPAEDKKLQELKQTLCAGFVIYGRWCARNRFISRARGAYRTALEFAAQIKFSKTATKLTNEIFQDMLLNGFTEAAVSTYLSNPMRIEVLRPLAYIMVKKGNLAILEQIFVKAISKWPSEKPILVAVLRGAKEEFRTQGRSHRQNL